MKEVKAVLLFADYKNYDFKKMEEELNSDAYLGICWTSDLTVKPKLPVYIYYTNIPDGINRICLKSEVILAQLTAEQIKINNDLYQQSILTKGFTISEPKGLKPKELDQFAFYNLKSKYKINSLRRQIYLYQEHQNLLDELEKTSTTSFKKIETEVFGLKCEFSDDKNEIFKKTGHPTFKRENGLAYYEFHHFIHRSQNNIEDKQTVNFIENKDNIIPLCSICHNRIHYGSIKEKKYMIDTIYQNRKEIIKEKTNITLEELYNMYFSTHEREKMTKEKNS